MPSGSKKRKAIRKRKEKEAHINENPTPASNNNDGINSSHENDELRRQDEKDGDKGDFGSPASHGHHQPFNGESEEPVKNDKSYVGLAADETKSIEIPIQSQDESPDKYGVADTIAGVMSKGDSGIGAESAKEIPPESQVPVKKLEEVNEVLGMETNQIDSQVEVTNPLPQEVTELMDCAKTIVETSEDININEPLASMPGKFNLSETAQVENTTDSKISFENQGIYENEVSQDSRFGVTSKKIEAKVYPVSTDSVVLDIGSNKQSGELMQSSELVICQANDGLESTEDTHVTEYSEKQPLVAPAPKVTSWMNCCGILDLFTGSSR